MGKAHTDDEVVTRIKPKLHIPEPSLYRVIYLNDEQTSFEFVIESLMTVFDHSDESAISIAGAIHEHGSAVVAVLIYELAEQKGVEVTTLARNNGFPLRVKIEQDN